MRIAFYDDNRDNNPASVDATWEELVELLSDVRYTACVPSGSSYHVSRGAEETHVFTGKECPHKYGQAWSPVDIEGQRANDNVRAVTVAVFDLDGLTFDQLQGVAERIDGYEYLVHSTHNHQEDEDRFYLRLVMPLSHEVPAALWRHVLRGIITRFKLPADPSCKDLSRLYFLPTIPQGRTPMVERGRGRSLDVASFTEESTPVEPRPRPAVEPAGDADTEPVDLSTLRGRLVEARRRKASSTKPEDRERYELLGRILKGDPLAEPGTRDNTVNQAASLLAFVLPSETPVDAALELLRPSVAAMDTEPEGVDHWMERAERSYSRAADRRAERDAKTKEMNEALAARMKALAPKEPAVQQDGEEWKKLLITKANGELKACGENAYTLLTYAPEVRGTFKFNEVEKVIEVHGGPFAKVHADILDVTVADWLQRVWGMSLSIGEVGQRIMRAARACAYDPLAQYLTELKWDGLPRASRFLTDYCGAVCIDSQGNDIADYLSRISSRWLISAVARALEPGSQVDTVLILEGKQGVRKTSALRVLGGPWFCDTQLVLGDKDSKMLAASNWIVEIAELASFKRSETEAQKAFLTTRTDKYRPPYGRVLVACPRRCVFVGTVNPEDGGYLTDRTGNRRYWPVYCNQVDLEALERDRDQLWAEAVHLFRAGERWWLDDEEQRVADAQAEERLGESMIESRIAAWWYSMHPDKRPKQVTSHEVAETGLRYTFDRINRTVQMEIGNALRKLGFDKGRPMIHGRLTYVYVPSEELSKAPQSGPTTAKVVALARVRDEANHVAKQLGDAVGSGS